MNTRDDTPPQKEKRRKGGGGGEGGAPGGGDANDRPVTMGLVAKRCDVEVPLNLRAAVKAWSAEPGTKLYERPNGLDLSARLPFYFFYSRARPRQT